MDKRTQPTLDLDEQARQYNKTHPFKINKSNMLSAFNNIEGRQSQLVNHEADLFVQNLEMEEIEELEKIRFIKYQRVIKLAEKEK